MERSLLFFYCIWGIAIVYFGIKITKDKYKWHSIALVVSAIISCAIASSFSLSSTGIWFALVIIFTFTILFITFFLLGMIKHYSIKRHIHKIISQLKCISSFNLVDNLVVEHNKYQWYVLHLPLDGSIEIGTNLYNTNPIIGKKFYIKTLTNRYVYFIPEYTPKEIDLKSNIVFILQDFYNINHQTRILVDDYILRIKNDHKEPWIISDEINKK